MSLDINTLQTFSDSFAALPPTEKQEVQLLMDAFHSLGHCVTEVLLDGEDESSDCALITLASFNKTISIRLTVRLQ